MGYYTSWSALEVEQRKHIAITSHPKAAEASGHPAAGRLVHWWNDVKLGGNKHETRAMDHDCDAGARAGDRRDRRSGPGRRRRRSTRRRTAGGWTAGWWRRRAGN